jgi:gamma-glutamyl:cysteine ligase YbdK (ATP-grasp superfamily)
MGDEIREGGFHVADFTRFRESLNGETQQLRSWFEEDAFAHAQTVLGYELEAWLIDVHGRPAPVNERFLESFASDRCVPELAKFNIEFNAPPRRLEGDVFDTVRDELARTWVGARAAAEQLRARPLMIGILPTVSEEMLNPRNMSDRARYRALNEQVLRMHGPQPIALDIEGVESLHLTHPDVMLEAGATSLQVHLQIDPGDAVRYYNAAQVLSGPMIAASTNSPFLFGRNLWAETRIPLFEQSVNTRIARNGHDLAPARVTFGESYVKASLWELFEENLLRHPVLLPVRFDDRARRTLPHLRLHNGTIWRWNRPLVGFEKGGVPSLRIEHRVMAAGPTVQDCVANAAFFTGCAAAYASALPAPEERLPFAAARANLYACARNGLEAQVTWLDGARGPVRELLLNELLPAAARGLTSLGLAPEAYEPHLDLVAQRVERRATGADWQRRFAARHGADMPALVEAYCERQDSGSPVWEWRV